MYTQMKHEDRGKTCQLKFSQQETLLRYAPRFICAENSHVRPQFHILILLLLAPRASVHYVFVLSHMSFLEWKKW